jgi:hypothetical protein
VDPWAKAPGYGSCPSYHGGWPQLGFFGGLSGKIQVAYGPAQIGFSFGSSGFRLGGDTSGLRRYSEGSGWFGKASHNLLDYFKPWNWRLKLTGDVGLDFGAYASSPPF